jgi:hypothetical protein
MAGEAERQYRERETDLRGCAAAGVGVRTKRTDACNAMHRWI